MKRARSRLRRLVAVSLAAICALVIMQVDLARATVWRFGPTETWSFVDGDPEAATYSPTWGQAYTRVWSDADQFPGAPVYIDVWMAGFWFSSQKITNINNLYQMQPRRYFTADLAHPNDYDTTVSVEAYSTTLPNPHYDWDDDPEPFGNGYADESEVTVTNPAPLQAYWSYDFLTIFRDMTHGNTAGYIAATAQRSIYDSFTGEYNTEYHFELATPDYNSYGLIGGLSTSVASAADRTSSAPSMTGTPLPQDPQDLPAYRALMVRRQAELAAAVPGAVNVNVTFKQLESLAILGDMRASGLNMTWFDGVATGGGRTVSLGTRVDDAGARQQALNRLLSETRTAFSGVYSVRGQISTAALAALQQDPRVDLVTVPDPADLQQAGGRVKAPPSIYWIR